MTFAVINKICDSLVGRKGLDLHNGRNAWALSASVNVCSHTKGLTTKMNSAWG